MKTHFLMLLALLLFTHTDLESQWVHRTTVPGGGRALPFTFVVGAKAYMGSGQAAAGQYTMDNYAYDPAANAWTQMKVPPMSARYGAAGFTIGQYGYVFGGSTGGNIYVGDLWRYDPASDSWTQMASLPTFGRTEPACFVINNRVYIVGGINGVNPVADCWEYNPAQGPAGTWTQKSSPPAGFSSGYLAGFTDGVNGYCGVGGGNSNCDNRFWRYDPVNDSWTELTTLPSPLRTWATDGTGLGNGIGFVGLGGCSAASEVDFWSYSATADSWTQLSGPFVFPQALAYSRSFRIGSDVYVGTGGKQTGREDRIWVMEGVATEDGCIDFEDSASVGNWYSYFVDDVSIVKEPGYGGVLRLEDGSGGSNAVNNVDFSGNWLERGEDGCLCFDYKVDWNTSIGSTIPSAPQIVLYTGPQITSLNGYVNSLRASFIGHATNSPIQDNQWDNFCLPISLCSGGALPSNSLGTWKIYNNGVELTGTAACNAWNTLIQNVTGVVLPVDYNSQPSELVYFDNFCWTCSDRDTCCVERESISTGWDHAAGATLSIGSANTFWQVVSDPNSSTVEPRPANVINPYALPSFQAWQNPVPGSQWISAASGSGWANGTGWYEFRACLCQCEIPQGAQLRVVLDVRSDNQAEIFVGGTSFPILTTGITSFASQRPTHVDTVVRFDPREGICITARVYNSSGPMGLNIGGFVELLDGNGDPFPGLRRVVCCQETGVIEGIKFWDRDCDGQQSPGESALPGWTITAEGNGGVYSAVTDANGHYSISVPAAAAGSVYTVTETLQSGWVQCSPLPPGNRVTVAPGGSVTLNFGNNRIPPKECLSFDSARVECRFDSTEGRQYYDLTGTISSSLDCGGNLLYGQVISASSTAGALAVSPSSFPVTAAPQGLQLSMSGSGATPGAVATLIVQVCCASDSLAYRDYCCLDTIRVTFPKEPCAPEGCFEIVDDTVECRIGPNGRVSYTYCFRVRNLSFFTASYLHLSGGGVTFSPATVVLGSLAPGAVSGQLCVTVTPTFGPGAYPLVGTMEDARRRFRCEGRTRFVVPECVPPTCCPGFAHFSTKLSSSTSFYGTGKFGNARVWGGMNVIGRKGCHRMTKVEGTIERATINGQPAGVYFSPWSNHVIGGVPLGQVTTTPYGQRIVWGPMSPVTISGWTDLRFVFPKQKASVETLEWCVRFRFTDECCNTCDTLICFRATRKKKFSWPPVKDDIRWYDGENEGDRKGGDPRPDAGPTIGEIITNDSAWMRITLPKIEGGRYVGLWLATEDEGVMLREVSSLPDTLPLLTANGIASSSFDLAAGTDILLGLKYDDFGGRKSIRHALVLRYIDAAVPEDTLEIGGPITLYRPGAAGGDEVREEEEVEDVRTFALYLRNANSASEPVARLALRARDGRKIYAIGPTADDSTAVIGLRQTQEGKTYSAGDVRGAEVMLSPGESVTPIYVTVSGAGDEDLLLDFVTLDESGEILSEGTINLVSGVTRDDREGGVAGSSILSDGYPNPTSGPITITFTLPRSVDRLDLVITDPTGKEIDRPIDGERFHAGTHVVLFDGGHLPSGTYHYTIRTADATETKGIRIVQ